MIFDRALIRRQLTGDKNPAEESAKHAVCNQLVKAVRLAIRLIFGGGDDAGFEGALRFRNDPDEAGRVPLHVRADREGIDDVIDAGVDSDAGGVAFLTITPRQIDSTMS